jgi:hypothetical protein
MIKCLIHQEPYSWGIWFELTSGESVQVLRICTQSFIFWFKTCSNQLTLLLRALILSLPYSWELWFWAYLILEVFDFELTLFFRAFILSLPYSWGLWFWAYLIPESFDFPEVFHFELTLFLRALIWALVPSVPWFFCITISASLNSALVRIRSLFNLFSPSV